MTRNEHGHATVRQTVMVQTSDAPPQDRIEIALMALTKLDPPEIWELLTRLDDRRLAAIKAVAVGLPRRGKES